ncbi:MAG TPA: uracil-DNA glycosylase [Gemmatimonadetes bacterium]|nr:uracil-DNA glycosylase [Gemmatimonadota bacterium]
MKPGSPRLEDLIVLLSRSKDLGLGAIVLDGLTREEILSSNLDSGVELGRTGGETVVDQSFSGTSAGVEVVSEMNYEVLEETAGHCQKCALCEKRNRVVFADGHRDARLMIIGEAPGAKEDQAGIPFVGHAGKFLDLLLASVSLSRKDSVYICNVLKCRPPANRDPLPDEIAMCAPYLTQQIALVAPEVILAVGTFAAQFLTGKKLPLGKLRGSTYSYKGVPLVITYHPAALLRNSGWTRPTWEDFQLLRKIMG